MSRVVAHHKNAIEEIRRKTEQQVHELEKEATETKQAFEQFFEGRVFKQNVEAKHRDTREDIR